MIDTEILQGWPRLAEHPELLAAVERDETVSDDLAAAAVLRALAGDVHALRIMRELIDLGATASARAVLDATSVAREGVDPQASQISAVDRQALLAELQDAGRISREELHVARARLEVRVRAAQFNVGLGWPHQGEPADDYLTELDRVRAAVTEEFEAHARQLEAAMLESAMDENRSTEWIAVVTAALREGRFRDAERLITACDDVSACWPVVPAGPLCDPAQVTPLEVWPWQATLEEVLGWLERGPQITLPPPGFLATFADPANSRSAEMLDALEQASPPGSREAILQAAACGLDALIERDGEPALVLEDAALAVVPALTRMMVAVGSSTPTAVALQVSASCMEVALTDSDVLAAVGAGALHRPRLLRVLGTQLDLELSPLGILPPPCDDPELLLAWGLWLLGVDPDDQAIGLVVVLAGDCWEVASRLLNVALSQHQRGTLLDAAAVASAWRSLAFEDQLRDWLGAVLASDEVERALMEGIVELDEDDAPLELLVDIVFAAAVDVDEERVTVAARALAVAGLVQLLDDGTIRSLPALRAVLRKGLGL